MNEIYYDPEKHQKIDLKTAILEWDEWKESKSGNCALYPDGFLVFIPYDKLGINDEYIEGDPYSVSTNINSSFHQRRFKSTVNLIRQYSAGKGSLTVLDLGCGEGHLTSAIKKEFPEHSLNGLDYSISAIKYAHANYQNIEFIVSDAYNTPYQNEYFDIVVLNNIWEHVPDPLSLLKEVSRILKVGGCVVISTPSRYRFSNLIRILKGKEITFISKLHVTEYSVGQVKELLKYEHFKTLFVISDPIKENRTIVHLLKLLLRMILKSVGSHHVLELTVFYLAIKEKKQDE